MAFSIPKRVGKAVVRNRLRRQLREAARRYINLQAGAYLVRAQPQAAGLDFPALLAHLESAATAATRSRTGERSPATVAIGPRRSVAGAKALPAEDRNGRSHL